MLLAGCGLLLAGAIGRQPALIYAAMAYFGAVIALVGVELVANPPGRR